MTEMQTTEPLEFLRPKDVARQLGLEVWKIMDLARHGLFVSEMGKGNTSFLLVCRSWNAEHVYRHWLSRQPPPSSYAEFSTYCHIRRYLGLHALIPYEPQILDAALIFMLQMGHVNRAETTATLQPPTLQACLDMVAHLRREAGLLFKDRARSRQLDSLDLASFTTLLPPQIAKAHGTCLEADADGTYAAPPPRILARTARLRSIFAYAAPAVLVLSATARRETQIATYLRALERIDDLVEATGTDWRDPVGMRSAILRFLRAEILPDVPRAVRGEAIRSWETLSRLMRLHARTVPREEQAFLKTILPAKLSSWSSINKRIREAIGDLRPEGRLQRKKRALVIWSEGERFMMALDRRRDQLAAVADNVEAAIPILTENGKDSQDLYVIGPVLERDGSFGVGLQRIRLRVWREKALLDSFIRSPVRGSKETLPLKDKLADILTAPDRYFVEYVGTEGEGDAQPVEPFWVDLLANAVQTWPLQLPKPVAEERRRVITALGLPSPNFTRSGLLTFSKADATNLRAGARRGRKILPVLEFDAAMRFAHLGSRCVFTTAIRPHGFMQMTSSKSGWTTVPTPRGPSLAFKAYPKLHRDQLLSGMEPSSYVIDDRTRKYVTDLEAMIRRRCHDGSPLPVVGPAKAIAWKRGPDRYLFAWRDEALSFGQLSLFLHYLAAGLADVRLHDLRHVAAMRLRAAGTPVEIIAEIIEDTVAMAEYYSMTDIATLPGALHADRANRANAQSLGIPRAPAPRPTVH